MSILQKFRNSMHRFNQKVKLGERITLLISLVAVIVSTVAILQTSKSISLEEQQVELAFQVATSNALIQEQSEKQGDFQQSLSSTQAVVNEYQKDLQSTQTALDLEFRSLMRQQSFPYLKAVSPDYILRFSEVKYHEADGSRIIEGVGTIDFNLANDGGGQAGWWKSNLNVEPSQSSVNLSILEIRQSNDRVLALPYNIPGQSIMGVKLTLGSQLTTNVPLPNKSDYQLGRLLVSELQKANTYLYFEFSNADPLRIQIDGFELNLPVISIIPEPSSPFPVTNADELGTICFTFQKESGEVFTGDIPSYFSMWKQNKEVVSSEVIDIKSGSCYSFPSGEFSLHWSSSSPIEQTGEVSFRVAAEEEKDVIAVIPEASLTSKVAIWIIQNRSVMLPVGLFAIFACVLLIKNFSSKREYVFSIVNIDNLENNLQNSRIAFYWLVNSRKVKAIYETREGNPGGSFSIRRMGFDKSHTPEFQVVYTSNREKFTIPVLLDEVIVLKPGIGVKVTAWHEE